ncbi:hypothetical protein BHE74_00053490 [Ensete ventricosum]|nr:hypothetical protein GW17_00033874 [Ensete ventricosum]RWW41042.1 hypothetical protein BHE74_00053490 [Ensete ventricosum]
MKLQPDDGPKSSLSIGSGFGRCSGISSIFAKIFAKGIKKLAGNIPGDRRKTYRKNARGYRIGGSTFGWLTRPGRRVNRPYSDFSDTVRFWL